MNYNIFKEYITFCCLAKHWNRKVGNAEGVDLQNLAPALALRRYTSTRRQKSATISVLNIDDKEPRDLPCTMTTSNNRDLYGDNHALTERK